MHRCRVYVAGYTTPVGPARNPTITLKKKNSHDPISSARYSLCPLRSIPPPRLHSVRRQRRRLSWPIVAIHALSLPLPFRFSSPSCSPRCNLVPVRRRPPRPHRRLARPAPHLPQIPITTTPDATRDCLPQCSCSMHASVDVLNPSPFLISCPTWTNPHRFHRTDEGGWPEKGIGGGSGGTERQRWGCSSRHGVRLHRHGRVRMLAVATAVAGRPLLSVQSFFHPAGVHLAKRMKRPTGRRGLTVPTYRNIHKVYVLHKN
jgi:hypothetical protein